MAFREGTLYTILFAAAICVVCAILVSVPAVTLRPRQQMNRRLDEQRNVLRAAGLVEAGQSLTRGGIAELFRENVRPVVIDLESGERQRGIDPAEFDQREAVTDPGSSRAEISNTQYENIAAAASSRMIL